MFEIVSPGAPSPHRAEIKLHTLPDFRGSIPMIISIYQGEQADVDVLEELVLKPGSFYVMDRGYADFQRLYGVLAAASFVPRAKTNPQLNRLESRPVDLRNEGAQLQVI